jgi:hypothetical protein
MVVIGVGVDRYFAADISISLGKHEDIAQVC